MAELASTSTPEGYDNDNIFAKILRGEIPSFKVFETEHAYAMLDAFPVCRYHCLILPKVSVE
jgi:histidine triad (HIT) family protein